MRRIFVQTIGVLLASACTLLMALGADAPTGTLDFKNSEIKQILAVYKQLSGAELFVDSRVNTVFAQVTVRSTGLVGKAEAMKLIETALIEQARVVITHLGENRVSVTFNDALPVKSFRNPSAK